MIPIGLSHYNSAFAPGKQCLVGGGGASPSMDQSESSISGSKIEFKKCPLDVMGPVLKQASVDNHITDRRSWQTEIGDGKYFAHECDALPVKTLWPEDMHTFAQRTILEVPEGWKLVVGFTTDSVHSILAQVNQNSHNKVKIAIQFEDGWNVDGWCVKRTL